MDIMRDILKFNRQEVYTFLSSFHPFSPRLNQLRVHSGLSLSQLSFREHVLNYKVTKISTKAIFMSYSLKIKVCFLIPKPIVERFLASYILIFVKNYHMGLNDLRTPSEMGESKLDKKCWGYM